MSQHDMTLDNASGLGFRTDANNALQALASQNSGASAPSPTFPCQVWGDTSTSRLKQRNAANTAWLDKGPLDSPLRDAASQGEFAADTGTANAYVCNFVPAITARSEATPIRFKASNANTGACTINDGIGVVALVGGAHTALQGGEIVANGIAWIQWNTSISGGSYVLLFCSGAAEQVANATKSQHAVTLSQAQDLVAAGPTVQGAFKNLQVFTTGSNALVGISCDEAVLKDPAGKALTTSNVFSSIDMASNGLNGLDTGAVAASSWYSMWLISNGTLFGAVAALIPTLNCNTTAGSAVVTGLASTASMRPGMPVSGGNVFTGTVIKTVDSPSQVTLSQPAFITNATTLKFQYDPVMPAGYTYKARVSSLPTDSTANKFPLGIAQRDDIVALQLGLGNTTNTRVIANGVQGNIAGAPAGWIAASLVALVPPTVSEIHGFAGNSVGAGTLIVAPNGLFGGVANNPATPLTVSGGASSPISTPFRFVLERFALMYASNVASATCNQLGWKDLL